MDGAERRVSVSAAAVASGRPVAVCNSTRSFDRFPRSKSVVEPGRGVARGVRWVRQHRAAVARGGKRAKIVF